MNICEIARQNHFSIAHPVVSSGGLSGLNGCADCEGVGLDEGPRVVAVSMGDELNKLSGPAGFSSISADMLNTKTTKKTRIK